MTVTAQGFSGPTFIQYNGNGVSTTFPFPFLITTATDLLVGFITAGVYSQQTTGFNVVAIYPGVGSVIFTTPPPLGTILDLRSAIPESQLTNFSNLGAYYPESTTNAVDRVTRNIADLYRLTYQFGIHGPDQEGTVWPALPSAASRAGGLLMFDTNGLPTLGVPTTAVLTQSLFNQFFANVQIYPPTPAELGAGVPVPNTSDSIGNVLRYGIVPNVQGSAAANTVILQALLNPTSGFNGSLSFPPVNGSDVYYFNANIAVHDGVSLDLCGNTIQFDIVGTPADNQCGCFTAQRDFEIKNGTLLWNYTPGTAVSNYGNGLMFGGRGNDVSLFPPVYDSLLPAPMGNIRVKNLRMIGNADVTQSRAIFTLGGVDGVIVENVRIDGQSTLFGGIYGEFGWATNEANLYQRQTSHPNRLSFRNVEVLSVSTTGLEYRGAYNAEVDNLKVYSSGGVCAFTPGESFYYRPWAGQDGAGAKHNISLRNIVGSVSGLGVNVIGAQALTSATYLDPGGTNPNGMTVANETDMLDFTLENFALSGTANNYGIYSAATTTSIRNGTVLYFQRGIQTTDESTNNLISGVRVLDSTGIGMAIGAGSDVYSPARTSKGQIIGCFVAGSGTAGTSAGIVVNNTDTLTIEECRFGYEVTHDNKSETTQSQAVNVQANGSGVTIKNCRTGGTSGGAVAYSEASSGTSRNNKITGCTGVVTCSGSWLTDFTSTTAQTIATAGTIAISNIKYIRVTNAGACTGVILVAGTSPSQEVYIYNEGTGSITFAASGTSNVADGAGDVIAVNTGGHYIWDAGTSFWYRM